MAKHLHHCSTNGKMEPNKGELLIRLLDDPDQLVFEAVSLQIRQMGVSILPELETAAMETMSPLLHERIELLIGILQHEKLRNDLRDWIKSPLPILVEGAWLMTRYQFPDLSLDNFIRLMKPLRDQVWLEISESLTALEKVRLMNTLLFGKSKIQLNKNHPESPGNNFINRVMETGKANEHSMCMLYAIIGQDLGLPLYITEMPGYPLLAYVDMPAGTGENFDPALFDILFYVNVIHGTVHSRKDINNYLNRQAITPEPVYFQPRTNIEFVRICLKKLAFDYELSGSEKRSSQILDLLKLWK